MTGFLLIVSNIMDDVRTIPALMTIAMSLCKTSIFEDAVFVLPNETISCSKSSTQWCLLSNQQGTGFCHLLPINEISCQYNAIIMAMLTRYKNRYITYHWFLSLQYCTMFFTKWLRFLTDIEVVGDDFKDEPLQGTTRCHAIYVLCNLLSLIDISVVRLLSSIKKNLIIMI